MPKNTDLFQALNASVLKVSDLKIALFIKNLSNFEYFGILKAKISLFLKSVKIFEDFWMKIFENFEF